ncbi:MAG: hypothetical protein ACYC1Z_08755 [Georgenia sp.]
MSTSLRRRASSARMTGLLATTALRRWSFRQVLAAAIGAVVVAVAIGVPTVLIPNPVFGREIPVQAWNYPVWMLTSLLAGLLVATYVRPRRTAGDPGSVESPQIPGEGASRAGMAGGVLTWFAVGCPVCNKIALVTLGYTGALTWFAPFQPVLAAAGVVMTAGALLVRLRGQVACSVPAVARV